MSFIAPHPLLDDDVWRPGDMQTFTRSPHWFWQDPVFGETGPFATQAEAEADCASRHQERRDLEAFARLIEPSDWLDWDRTRSRQGFCYDTLYASMRTARRVLAAWADYQSSRMAPPAIGASPTGRSADPGGPKSILETPND